MAAMRWAIKAEPIIELKTQLHKHSPNMDVWCCLTPWKPADHYYVIIQIFSYLLLFYWLRYDCIKKREGADLLRSFETRWIGHPYLDLDR